jgi:hypothetical protein
MMRKYLALLALVGAAVAPAGAVRADPSHVLACTQSAEVGNDFDADGYGDLLVTAGLENLGSIENAGSFHALYGSASGVTTDGNQEWTQDSGGTHNESEEFDQMGRALATADFNGDGYTDVAVGVDGQDVPVGQTVVPQAGMVHVIYGSAQGLQASSPDDQVFSQNTPNVEDDAEEDDRWGNPLAAGDFNDDGYGDLAVSAEAESVGIIQAAGGVNVLYGSASGLTATGDQFWTQDSSGIADQPEAGDSFGWGLAAGDFDSDGIQDLAVGAMWEDLEEFDPDLLQAGVVHVILGSASGLTGTGSQFYDQGDFGGEPEHQDRFGRRIGAGDFDGDGYDDVATGAAFEDVGEDAAAVVDAGAANVAYGSASGLTSGKEWTQDTPGILDAAEEGEHFGWFSVGIGDFNDDGRDDLGISVTGEGGNDAGAAAVIYGSASGLTATGNQLWTQDSSGIPDSSEAEDRFGRVSRAQDFNDDGCFDLVVGAGTEDVGAINGAGAAHVIYGSASGLASTNAQVFTQDDLEGEGAEANDNFGRWLLD